MKQTPSLDLQSVQATMLLPLWGRAKYSKLNPDILEDHTAIQIIENSEFDFSETEKAFGEFGGLCYIVRARKIDDAIRRYIKKYPYATVVSIGAGLDTGFSRVDNGTIRWYNLDLPEAIAYRKSLVEETERNTCIAKSFFDVSWFEDISYEKEKGIMFVAGGVFYYFTAPKMQQTICAMAQRFAGGEVYFDAESKKAVEYSNKMVEKSGNKGARMHFYVDDTEQIAAWSDRINEVKSEAFFKDIPRKRSWSGMVRMRMSMLGSSSSGMMKFIHIKFAD